jgi:cytochrome c biogenesis protein CcmG/thiol:disulfide interchange protein DsbE
MKRPWLVWVPLLAFAILLLVVSIGLQRNPQQVIMSRMIDKAVPGLDLPAGSSSNPPLSTKGMADGKVRLINIFASWCVPCIAEAPQLVALQQRGVLIEGIAIRDARADVDAFLARNGNPYDRIGLDARSTMQFYLGSSGVPESYVVDGRGIIRYQHWGPIMPQDMETILAKLKEAAS